MDDFTYLTNFIHAFSDPKSTYAEKVAGGSTVLNRIDSNNPEYGTDGIAPTSIRDVLYSKSSPYYEVNGNNERWNEAESGKVAKYNQESYKESMQIARGLMSGDIPRVPGEYVIKPEERKEIESKGKEGKKQFNFDKVKKTGTFDRYDMYTNNEEYEINVQSEKKPKNNVQSDQINVQSEIPTYTGKFNDAFRDARKSGHKEFIHGGKLFNTKVKGE